MPTSGATLAAWSVAAVLLLAGCAAGGGSGGGTDPARLQGREWIIESIAGTAVVAGSTVTASFGTDGRIAGRASCNRYTGGYTATKDALAIGPLAATKMACAPPLMQQEQRFLELLQSVRRWELASAGTLVLIGAGDARIVAVTP